MKGIIMNINELCSILNVSDLHLTNESDINELFNATCLIQVFTLFIALVYDGLQLLCKIQTILC